LRKAERQQPCACILAVGRVTHRGLRKYKVTILEFMLLNMYVALARLLRTLAIDPPRYRLLLSLTISGGEKKSTLKHIISLIIFWDWTFLGSVIADVLVFRPSSRPRVDRAKATIHRDSGRAFLKARHST
jgi:hypothetical protein